MIQLQRPEGIRRLRHWLIRKVVGGMPVLANCDFTRHKELKVKVKRGDGIGFRNVFSGGVDVKMKEDKHA